MQTLQHSSVLEPNTGTVGRGVYQQSLADYYLATSGYGDLLLQAEDILSPVTGTDAVVGFSCHLPLLDRVSAVCSHSVTSAVQGRRQRALQEWAAWAEGFPPSLRPSLATCSPYDFVCFLEHWRSRTAGRRKPGDPEPYSPDVAPSTLRNFAGRFSYLFSSIGRSASTWSRDNPSGSPLSHDLVKDYLNGYSTYCFRHTPYTEAGAVPMELATYLRYQDYLQEASNNSPTSLTRAAILRDACLSAYLWETGQRGKEGAELLISDFCYHDVRCTPAWPDLAVGQLYSDRTLLVESSQGTKSRKTKHPGTLKLETTRDPCSGSGLLAHLLSSYCQAMSDCGSPLISHLFRPLSSDGTYFSHRGYSSAAFSQRIKTHLQSMGCWAGETSHSLRRGSTQLLKSQGASNSEIGEKRLWRRDDTIDRYTHPTRHRARLASQPLGTSSSRI